MAAAAFEIRSTNNRQKGYSMEQLIFVCGMILPIKHTVDCELVRQQNQKQINKDNISENRHIVDHNYKVWDDGMLTKHTA